jgi:hypothetical protein
VAAMFGIAPVLYPDVLGGSSGPSTAVETRRPWLKTEDNFAKYPTISPCFMIANLAFSCAILEFSYNLRSFSR